MGGKLIYTYPEKVSFPLSSADKESKLSQFINFIDEFYGDDYFKLSRFLMSLDTEEFFQNKTNRERYIGIITIPKDIKVLKSFKFFVEDKQILRQLQDAASRIIQENTISGYMCFSVHPLDYLSISENNHNWRSCHALDGDYRGGNLSYMMDDTTVICYLKGDKEEVLPRFPEDVLWNSKKWRVLLYFSQDKTMMFAGRSYPFSFEGDIDFIRREILPLVKLGFWSKWQNSKISRINLDNNDTMFFGESMYPVGNNLVSITNLIKNKCGALQYNDLYYSHVYTAPYYSYYEHQNSDEFPLFGTNTRHTTKDTRFNIGEAPICVRCGEKIITSTDSFLCESCADDLNFDTYDDLYECACCGKKEPIEELRFTHISDVGICADCYNFHKEEFEIVDCKTCFNFDFKNVMIYDEDHRGYVCPQCMKRR